MRHEGTKGRRQTRRGRFGRASFFVLPSRTSCLRGAFKPREERRVNARYDMVYCFAVRTGGSEGHEILQLRRAIGDFMGGTWQTVVGKIETGEKAWQAAARELRE